MAKDVGEQVTRVPHGIPTCMNVKKLPIHKQNLELMCRMKIVKSCEKQSKNERRQDLGISS